MKDIAERQRNGTWNGIPSGMSIVVDSDGNERLNRTTVDEGAMKSKDIQKNDNGAGRNEEITALLMLGRPKTTINKSSSDDEGLEEAFEDLLNDEEVNLNSKGNVSPLPSLGGDENDPENEVDYGGSDEDYLGTFEEGGQAPSDQEGAPAMVDENNQSQDAQQTNQPLGIDETRAQASPPVLTKQGVMDLVSKDSGTLTPSSGWERRKQSYCDMLKGYESPNGTSVRGLVQALWCLAVRVRYLQSDPL